MSNETILKTTNLDADQTAFFLRELEYVKAQTFDVQYPELLATQLIPVSMEAGPGAESITYQQFDQVGLAKVIANYAEDLPSASIKGKEFTARVRSLGTSYTYSLQDIRNAQFAGRNLEQRQANAARRAIEQKIDNIAWHGDEQYNLQGLVTHPNITRTASTQNGEDAAPNDSTLWIHKTADQILDDMNDLVTGIVDLTNGVERPNTMLMPIAQYNLISTRPRGLHTDTTILQFFLQNSPFINEVIPVFDLKNAGVGVGGVGANSDVVIAYDRNPDKITLEIPQPFEQFAPQEENLAFKIPVHARIAGLILYYPLSVSILEGV